MNPSIIHSIAVCLTALALPFVMACSSQDESLLEDISEATLYMNVEPVSLTRTGAALLPDNEKMHSVRVIILHSDGTVEHNKFYSLDGAQEQKSFLLKVTPNEKKKVYIFANEESVSEVEGVADENTTLSAFFDSYREKAYGFEEAVNSLYFTPDYTEGNNIPMSSEYEIDVPEKGTVEETFYVVRVATKFIVNFFNWRGEEVRVEKFSIASHADKNFLMAHVKDSEQNRLLFDGESWINWLKNVSDASSENDDYATTEAAGWLKDYDLPALANRNLEYTFASSITVASAEFDENNLDDIKPGEASEVFYLPESMNLKDGATDGEQEYILKVYISGLSEPFVRKLPNLKALFRNTNVVINVTMYKNMEMVVDVIPFTSVEVDPDYGLDREDFTGYIVGKDEDGNKCWYDGGDGPYYLGPKDSLEKFVTINEKEYLLVYADYDRTAAKLDHFFEKGTRKKYLLDAARRTGYTFTLNPEHPEWGPDIYYNKFQQRVWLSEDYNEWIVAEENNVEVWNWQAGTTWYRTLNEWDRLNWNQAIYWKWTHVYPKYWFDVLGNRYPWSEGDTKEKRAAIIREWVQYLE